MSMMPALTAAVCTFNRAHLLEGTLESLQRQTAGRALHVIVADNGSTDTTRAIVARWQRTMEGLTYLHAREPGLSHARNHALRACETPLIAFIDDDAIAEADWGQNLVSCFASGSPRLAGVGGRILPIWEVPRPAWLRDGLEDYFSILDRGETTLRLEEPRIFGANMAFIADALRACGGFSPRLGRAPGRLVGHEELAAARALLNAGHELVYCGGAVVRHLVPKERLKVEWLTKRVHGQGVSDGIFYTRVEPSPRTVARLLRDALVRLDWRGRESHVEQALNRAYLRGAIRGVLRGC